MEGHYHHYEEGHHDEKGQSETSYDPHIWLSPSNVKKMGAQILEHLLESMPENEVLLKKNYEKLFKPVI